MTNKFLTGLQDATNVATTANGARAFATTKSDVLDFFAQGGALRQRTAQEKIKLFTKAFAEDKLLALKSLFYFRDIREGQGERQTFRDILKYMANNHSDYIAKNIHLIPFFGRWDDLYVLDGTKLETLAFSMLKKQFYQDINSQKPSILGKWLKSENASSPATRKLGVKTRKAFELSPRQYRKSLTALRDKLNVLETTMSAKEWEEINYSQIPSQAGLRYRQAFHRNDSERYTAFIDSLKRGDKVDAEGKEIKINTKTLYPYQIVEKILTGGMHYHGSKYYATTNSNADADTLDVLWNNLPDYFGENTEDSICVVDTSGSMAGTPISVAISLGIYAAERNKGAFKDHFITFSDRPELVKVQGSNIVEKVSNLSRANWDMNTNIEKVFDLILDTAIKNRLSQDEIVTRIYVISDMQFDSCTRGSRDKALFRVIRERFENAGYQMPSLVFWNVNSSITQVPMTITDTGVQVVSGMSPTIFTALLKNKLSTAYELMLDVLNSERYDLIQA